VADRLKGKVTFVTDKPHGPDLTQGIPASELADGTILVGHVGEGAALLVRHGGKVSGIAPHCTHYHGPLADGLVVRDTIRCPWHHACFSLKTGEALAAPALSPVDCWQVEEQGGRITVGSKKEQPAPKKNRRSVRALHHCRRRSGRNSGQC
jgi:nitrite reductase/ring-hydroxylating ferredoxin subunit